MNEVAMTLVESFGKESVVIWGKIYFFCCCWVRFRGNLVNFSEIPPDLSLHTRNWTFYAMHAIYVTQKATVNRQGQEVAS